MQDGGRGPAPTGCFKCGRPGHWSRDCPSSASVNPNPSSYQRTASFPSKSPHGTARITPGKSAPVDGAAAPANTSKRLPKTRPKLTPELLLSDDGLGYVLRHFPKAFKYHGRGHEARDLNKLISLYAQWHSHLIPYYSLDQFVQKVEQIGCTRRVKMCLRELRDRVSNGGDPTKLHEPPREDEASHCGPADTELPVTEKDDPPIEKNEIDDMQEDMIDEIYRDATEESPHCLPIEQPHASKSTAVPEVNNEDSSIAHVSDMNPSNSSNYPSRIQITEEQKARMEANRLKALERAAARGHASQAS